jgi:hypothetical protein
MRKLLLFITMLIFATSQNLWASEIRIIGRHADAELLKTVVRDNLLNHDRYRRMKFATIDVKVVKKDLGRQLVAFMKARDTYLFETSIISLTRDNRVTRLEPNVTVQRMRVVLPNFPVIVNLCPDNTVQAVFATPADDIASAVEGVEQACITAENAGLKCKNLIGDQASVAAYKAYLTFCPKLKAFGNIGHGNTNGIILANNEVLDHGWFNALNDTTMDGIVTYFNSCQVHNNPLDPAIMSAGTRTFIGGDINLGIGTSEEVFKCFWEEVLVNKRRMGTALELCEQNEYPLTGAHGISGDENWFNMRIVPIPRPIPIPRPFP